MMKDLSKSDIDINEKTRAGYELSIVVLMYNTTIDRLRKTLKSALNQKNVKFEIVITDDGSKDNHEEEIREYFEFHNFKDFQLVLNEQNKGTVSNLLSALSVTCGEYIKLISPGDCLIDVSRKWIDYMKESGCDWSFADSIYYQNIRGDDLNVSQMAHPQILTPYRKGNKDICRWNYVVLGDITLGAAVMGSANIMKKYTKILSDNGVVYAEDNMWRLMMFDGIVGGYLQENAVLYEYGTGISTSGSDVWSQRISQDWVKTDEIMRKHKHLTDFQAKMLKYMGSDIPIIEKIMTKGKIAYYLKSKIFTRMTAT